MTSERTLLRDAVRDAVRVLTESGIHSAEFDAVTLAACALDVSTSEVHKLMVLARPIPDNAKDRFNDLICERSRRVPLQHLTGRAGFRNLTLQVGPGVFIPRFETEQTTALAITHLLHPNPTPHPNGSRQFAHPTPADLGSLPAQPDGSRQFAHLMSADRPDKLPRSAPEPRTNCLDRRVVVDLCAGSGAIALAIKDEVPSAEVHAVELSELALAWAVRNRDDLGLEVDLRLGDATVAFADLEGGVDVVVSNPPYIPVGAVPNDPEVRDHDPEVALYGGSPDGLRIPLEVAGRAAALLRPGGLLVMEHADVQGDSLPAALRMTGLWQDIQDHDDLNGRPRAVTAFRAD